MSASSAVLRAEGSNRRSGLEIYVVFMLSPIIALLSAFRNYRARWSKDIMWLFVVFFGFTFVVGGQMDSVRYSQRLVMMSRLEIVNTDDFVSLLYAKKTGFVDVVEPFVIYVVSRFTDNSRVLFAVFGLIFGYFYSRNLWFLLGFVNGKIARWAMPFLLLSALAIGIWQINGFRFNTAAQVFVFGLFSYLGGMRVKGIIVCVLSAFVHFSFSFAVLLFAIYIIIGNRTYLFFALYFTSFFLAQVNPALLRDYASSFPEVFQERTESYTNEDYLREKKSFNARANWYVEGRMIAIHYAINLWLLYLFFFFRRGSELPPLLVGMLCLGLLLASITNLLGEVGSMNRFQLVADMILYSFLFLWIQRRGSEIVPRLVSLPFLFAAVVYVVVEIRVAFETTSLLTILGNPIIAPFIANDFPLISFFK